MSSDDFSTGIKEYSSEILRVCSYHRLDFDLVVVRSRPSEMQSVQASSQSAFERLPAADLGPLGTLPVEVMSLVLCELDIRSFFNFRQVNRQARFVSTGFWEYNLVSRHGLEGLRGLLRAGLSTYFTISDLYRALTTDKCSTCAAFGGHLFLFTAERSWFNYLVYSSHYRVVSPFTLSRFVIIAKSQLNILLPRQRLYTVRGIYNMLERPARRPNCLVFEEKATETLLALGAIGEDVVLGLRIRPDQQDQRFMAATAYPYYNLEDAKLEPGVSCKGCQVRHQIQHDTFITYDQVFSTQGLLSHFLQCVEAQHLWTASEKGTRPVDEPHITRSCGYFSKLGRDGLPA